MKMKVFCAVVLLSAIGNAVMAKYSGGSGTVIDPYLIATAADMNTIGANSSDWDKHFKMIADVDLAGYRGTMLKCIGDDLSRTFKGVFDGQGHTISNYNYATTDTTQLIGIFGMISGEIKNVGVINPNVVAPNAVVVSSLVGQSEYSGYVNNCFVRGGSVKGKSYVGPLIGFVGANSKVENCYAVSSTEGESFVGGLAGANYGRIYYCYASSAVTCGGSYTGGLAGLGYATKTFLSFWNNDLTGTGNTVGKGRNSTEMKEMATFAGWGVTGVWVIDEGADFPKLAWEGTNGAAITDPQFLLGLGTEASPYLITSSEGLNLIGKFTDKWDKCYRLVCSIDMGGYQGVEYNIIGNGYIPFTGSFDGGGNTIGGLSFKAERAEAIGSNHSQKIL